jgi:Zn-dependent peptidase ImmA (M78 family)
MTDLRVTTGTDVETKARAVLARYTGDEPGDVLWRICRGEGVALADADLGDLRGILRQEAGAWRIYLNRQDTPVRRRFTLARLLGHYFLHAAPGRTFVAGMFCTR